MNNRDYSTATLRFIINRVLLVSWISRYINFLFCFYYSDVQLHQQRATVFIRPSLALPYISPSIKWKNTAEQFFFGILILINKSESCFFCSYINAFEKKIVFNTSAGSANMVALTACSSTVAHKANWSHFLEALPDV